MSRVLIAVALAGMLSAGSGCCSCLHEAAAWRKSWAAPHVCGHHGGPFGKGCCPCGGCDSCTNGGGCETCSHGGGCGGHGGWLGDGGVDRCDPCCDDGCWDHGNCDHCGEGCNDDCSMWLADDWGRGCGHGGGGGCLSCGGGCGHGGSGGGLLGGHGCCPCGGGCDSCTNGGGCGGECGGCGHGGGFTLSRLFGGFGCFGGCKGNGCGAFYWNEWFNDPPCCYDPCDCTGEYIGDTCEHGTACGGCPTCNGGGGHGAHGGGYMPGGHAAKTRGVPYYGRATNSGQHAGESYAMRQAPRTAAATSRAKTSDMPFSIETNLGQGQKASMAPRTATRQSVPTTRTVTPGTRTSAKPRGKTSAGNSRPNARQQAVRQPTPAVAPIEEKIVEGSVKVIEDRAAQPSESKVAAPVQRNAPTTAKRRVRATRTSLQREPTT